MKCTCFSTSQLHAVHLHITLPQSLSQSQQYIASMSARNLALMATQYTQQIVGVYMCSHYRCRSEFGDNCLKSDWCCSSTITSTLAMDSISSCLNHEFPELISGSCLACPQLHIKCHTTPSSNILKLSPASGNASATQLLTNLSTCCGSSTA